MSTLNIWIVGIACYMVGVILGAIATKDHDAEGPVATSLVVGLVLLLILIGVKIGGAT